MNEMNYKVRFKYNSVNDISEYYIEDVNKKGFPNKGEPFLDSKYLKISKKEIEYKDNLNDLDINHMIYEIKDKHVESLYQANFLLCKLRLKSIIAKINKNEY